MIIIPDSHARNAHPDDHPGDESQTVFTADQERGFESQRWSTSSGYCTLLARAVRGWNVRYDGSIEEHYVYDSELLSLAADHEN
jgi:hypothetical protein